MSATALSSWEASLAFLADDVAEGIERMAKRLDLAIGDPTAAHGLAEPNGYGGIDRRGPFDRLLLSDWALAELEPDEFLRRLVTAELSFLRLEQREPHPPGQVSILMDSGPDQIGAPRLVQLAGLVVLSRRARAHGVQLLVGIAGDEPGQWLGGELPELFSAWLRSRRPMPVTAEIIAAWDNIVDRDRGVAWLFGAPKLNDSSIPKGWRRLWAAESSWGAAGATEVVAVVDGRSLHLDLPESSISIRILRGHGIRREQKLQIAASDGPVRFPRFPGAPRRLVCRGTGNDELLVVGVPQTPGESGGRARIRQFPGPVLAASVVGSRTVALVAMEGGLRVVVIGKRLGSVDSIYLTLGDLEMDHRAVAAIASDGLPALYFQSGSIVVRLDDQWWSIDASSRVTKIFPSAMAATAKSDQPAVVWMMGGRLWFGGAFVDLPADSRVMLGSKNLLGVEAETGRWRVHHRQTTSEITIEDDATAVGLLHLDGLPTLLVLSPGGRLLRLKNTEGAKKTLTKLSGDIVDIAVHPTEPLAAIQRVNGSVDVADLATSQVLLHLGIHTR